MVKKLHLAKDFSTLKKQIAELPKSLEAKNPTALQRALPELFRSANSAYEAGDEEKAFILYMRFADLGESLQKEARLREAEKKSLPEDVKKAIIRCELLSTSLKERYEQAQIEERLAGCPVPPKSAIDKPPVENGTSNAPMNCLIPSSPVTIANPPSDSSTSDRKAGSIFEALKIDNGTSTMISNLQTENGSLLVTSAELRDLLLKRDALVLDVRTAEAFKDSHIKISPEIINISGNKIYAGITAHRIEELLCPKDKELFNRRKSFKKIIIVDWEGREADVLYSKPYCVFEALKKWVPTDDAITCWHLKSGYKLWTTAFPHDTTNPKPDSKLNEPESSEAAYKQLIQAEIVSDLSWLPETFERVVNVIPSPTVTPIVKPRISEVSRIVENGKPSSSSQKITTIGAEDSKREPPCPTRSRDTEVPTVNKEECSEITKIDKTSQDTIKQFTMAVNEKISKPRTFSEVEGSTPQYRQPKASLMRSRSMSDIYEESSHRDSFTRGLEENFEAKRPSFDRSLKPTQCLEAATIHQAVDIPLVPNNNRNNQNGSSVRGGGTIKHTSISLLPAKTERVKPPIPSKNRRSQSPVQVLLTQIYPKAYFYGSIDRTAGLRNLRNTCYLNSVVQALAHSTEFAHYFVRKEHLADIHDPKRGSLATLFARLLAQLWSQTDTREVLTHFREHIGTRVPMYRSSDQQDSHEFLMSLLTVLHEDLNVAPKSNSQTPCDDSDLVVTFEMLPSQLNEFCIAHRERESSIVTSNFEGVLLSGLKCLTCEKDSYTFQVFTVLSVPVPSSWPQVDLQACFDQFFKEERVEEWHCPHCKKKRSATKQMKIARLPKHLIIHLIRFKNEPWISPLASIKKVTNKVHFTEELDTRDFAQHVYSKNVQLKSYTLYAIVKHHGTLSNGHYIAECRFLGKQAQSWYSYNDQEVTPLRRTVDVDNAYMLFYSCVKNLC